MDEATNAIGRQASPAQQFASACLAMVAGLSTTPWVQSPGADREFYRYVGMLWAKGGVPYRDVFDIKPPLVFLGAWGGSQWLLWCLINLTLAWAAAMLCNTLSRFRVPAPVLWTALAMGLMRLPTVAEGGGLSYELSAAFCIMFVAQATQDEPWYPVLGGLVGLVALTQQSDLLGLLPFFFVAARRSKALWRTAVNMVSWAGFVLGLAMFYFVNRGALLAWWHDTWVFPLTYFTHAPMSLPTRAVALGRALWATRLLPFLLWAVAMHAYGAARRQDPAAAGDIDTGTTWQNVVPCALVLQTLAICVAGKFYGHYFLSFVGYLVLFMGGAWRAGVRCLPQVHNRRAVLVGVLSVWVLGPLAVMMSPFLQHKVRETWGDWQLVLNAWQQGTTAYELAVAHDRESLRDVFEKDGQLFVFRGYGRPLALYSELQVRAPTRYVHTLFWDTSSRGADELTAVLQDLDNAGTRYVLDYSLSKPLADAVLQARWDHYRDAHYTAGRELLCDGGGMACGRVYTRRM